MESKHIAAVKEPWWQSSQWNMLRQMLTTNSHLDKLAAAQVDFASHGMLEGTVLDEVLNQIGTTLAVWESLQYLAITSKFDAFW